MFLLPNTLTITLTLGPRNAVSAPRGRPDSPVSVARSSCCGVKTGCATTRPLPTLVNVLGRPRHCGRRRPGARGGTHGDSDTGQVFVGPGWCPPDRASPMDAVRVPPGRAAFLSWRRGPGGGGGDTDPRGGGWPRGPVSQSTHPVPVPRHVRSPTQSQGRGTNATPDAHRPPGLAPVRGAGRRPRRCRHSSARTRRRPRPSSCPRPSFQKTVSVLPRRGGGRAPARSR